MDYGLWIMDYELKIMNFLKNYRTIKLLNYKTFTAKSAKKILIILKILWKSWFRQITVQTKKEKGCSEKEQPLLF